MKIPVGKYLHAEESEIAYGKPVYILINNASGATVAQIGWYPRWKRFVMYPAEDSVFDLDCLPCIVEFMRGLSS